MSKSWYVVSVRKYRLYLTNSIVALFMSKYNRFKCYRLQEVVLLSRLFRGG
jgi:hypothetical protein